MVTVDIKLGCLFVHPSVCPSGRLYICPSVRPSVCLSVCLFGTYPSDSAERIWLKLCTRWRSVPDTVSHILVAISPGILMGDPNHQNMYRGVIVCQSCTEQFICYYIYFITSVLCVYADKFDLVWCDVNEPMRYIYCDLYRSGPKWYLAVTNCCIVAELYDSWCYYMHLLVMPLPDWLMEALCSLVPSWLIT